MRGEGVEPPGDPVIEARADADDQVGPVHRHVGFIGAVHAQHAEPFLAMVGGESSQGPSALR